MKTAFLSLILFVSAFARFALADKTPKIFFESPIQDFGIVSAGESVQGSFKVQNTGDGILRLERVSTSCGCTTAALQKATLAPGESSKIEFTLTFGQVKGYFEKVIRVLSNDPQNAESALTIKLDHRPLYEVTPRGLLANLSLGEIKRGLEFEITRTDGQPIHVERIVTSKAWLVARAEPTKKPSSSRILVEVQGTQTGRFSETVSIYPASSTPPLKVRVSGQIQGELSVSPEKLFWTLTSPSQEPGTKLAEPALTRRFTVVSITGKPFELKNARSAIEGLKLDVHSLGEGKGYEVIASLSAPPAQNLNGSISLETSIPSQPTIEVPCFVHLFEAPMSSPIPAAPTPAVAFPRPG